MCSFTLFFHLTTGPPLLLGPSISITYIFSTTCSLFILSIRPSYLNVCFSPNTPLHTLLHLHKFPCHIFHTCFNNTHSHCCALFYVQVWFTQHCWQGNTVPSTTLYHEDHIPSSHNPCKWSYDTTLTLFFCFHLAMPCSQILQLFHFLHSLS